MDNDHDVFAHKTKLSLLRFIDGMNLFNMNRSQNTFSGLSFRDAVVRTCEDNSLMEAIAANQLQNLIRDGYVETLNSSWRHDLEGVAILDIDLAGAKVSLTTKGREYLQSLLPTPAEAESLRLANEALKHSERTRVISALMTFFAIIASIFIALWLK